MDVNISSKYLEQNKTYKYIETFDVLNASAISKVKELQIVLKKDGNIIFNKVMKLYDDFKIYIDDTEKDIYELTKNYFPLIGNEIYKVDIDMNMEIVGTHESKIKTIKIYHHSQDASEDIIRINKEFTL